METNKRTLNNILYSLGFFVGLAILLLGLSLVIPKDEDVYDAASVNAVKKELDAETKNSLDIIFVGDSECYSNFSPMNIWKEYGITSYTCGTSAQKLCDTYAILSHMFKTQQPKAIVLEANCMYRKAKPVVPSDGDVVMGFLTNNVDAFKYHSQWKAITNNVFNVKELGQKNVKGFIVRKTTLPYKGDEYMIPSEEAETIPEDTLLYLDKILDLCKENDSELIVVSAPSARNWTYAKHNGINAWTSEKNLTYLDLNLIPEVEIDWSTDTKDGGDHVNLKGAKKVSLYLGKYLTDRFNIEDKSENPKYKKWKKIKIPSM